MTSVTDTTTPVKGLSLPARRALLSATDPDAFKAQCRRAMGTTPSEVTYMARLRGAIGRATRWGTPQMFEGKPRTLNQLRGLHARYQAAQKGTRR